MNLYKLQHSPYFPEFLVVLYCRKVLSLGNIWVTDSTSNNPDMVPWYCIESVCIDLYHYYIIGMWKCENTSLTMGHMIVLPRSLVRGFNYLTTTHETWTPFLVVLYNRKMYLDSGGGLWGLCCKNKIQASRSVWIITLISFRLFQNCRESYI